MIQRSSAFPQGSSPLAITAILLAVLCSPASTTAQELEPRAFSAAPTKLNFVVVAYSYSTGNIFLDPSLPIEDAEGNVNTALVAYARTLNFFGKSAKLDVLVPYSWGTWSGDVDGFAGSTTRSDFADPRFRLSVNFLGAPALDAAEFRGYRPRQVVGASLQVIAPLGEYDGTRIISLGSNRWTARPSIGTSWTRGKWNYEFSGTAWFFGDNDDLFGLTLEQEPIYSVTADVIYNFRPGMWLSFDAGYGLGGRTRVSGELRNTEQNNWRWGLTYAYPLDRLRSLKLVVTSGLSTGVGAQFDSVLVAYQYRWSGGLPAGSGAGKH